MSANVSVTLQAAGAAGYAATSGALNGVSLQIPHQVAISLQPGSGADNASKTSVNLFTFTASNAQTMNMQSLLQPDGSACNFAQVHYIEVTNLSTADGATLTITPDATNGWSNSPFGNGAVVGPSSTNNPYGGFFVAGSPNTSGWPITNSTHTIDLTPAAFAFSARILVVGQ